MPIIEWLFDRTSITTYRITGTSQKLVTCCRATFGCTQNQRCTAPGVLGCIAGSAGMRGHCSASRPVPAPDSACRNTGCNRVAGRLRAEIRTGRCLWPRFTAHLRLVGVGAGARCVGDPRFRGRGRKNRVSVGWCKLGRDWHRTPRQVDWCP